MEHLILLPFYFFNCQNFVTLKYTFLAAIESLMVREEDIHRGVLWRCTVCGHCSKLKTHVAFHVEAKHIESNGFHCTYCSKYCPSKNALQTHVSRYHRNPKQ